jgi:hypothetical protein
MTGCWRSSSRSCSWKTSISNLEATGFEIGEIDLRIQGLTSLSDEDEGEDDLAELSDKPAVTRAGDLWLLGEHRVYCGSALDPLAYATLLGTEQAKVVGRRR